MIQWYPGACNVQTVIKEACFLGERGGYVAAGSDDGRCDTQYVVDITIYMMVSLVGRFAGNICVRSERIRPILFVTSVSDENCPAQAFVIVPTK